MSLNAFPDAALCSPQIGTIGIERGWLFKYSCTPSSSGSTGSQREGNTCFSLYVRFFHSAVDYKGFRVVVIPLPESVPEVIAWPQPLSARVRHVSH